MSDLPFNIKQGLQSFNHGDYYAAHEYFEDAWRETTDDTREFYRALLHLSGGYYRLTQDRSGAALKFFQRSLQWMEQFPNPVCQIDTDLLRTLLGTLIAEIQSGKGSATLLKEHKFQINYPHQE